jgi:hypothetical protein
MEKRADLAEFAPNVLKNKVPPAGTDVADE